MRLRKEQITTMRIRTIITCILCSFVLMVAAQHDDLPRKTLNGKEFYVYKIKKGDGFYSVSKKFNTTQDEIIQYNPSAKNGLKRDQVLFIPIPDDGTKTTESATFTHTIKRGETLSAISKMYNVTIDDICELNPNARRRIYAGDKLLIPQREAKSAASTASKATTSESASNTTTSSASSSVSNSTSSTGIDNTTTYSYHTIRSGETLYSIAEKHNTTVEVIMRANPGIKPNSLARGAVIRIPGQSKAANLSVDKQQDKTPEQPIITEEVTTDNTVIEEIEEPQGAYTTYTAKRRETFFSIAQKFGIDMQALKAANPKVSKVNQGTVLNIPVVEEEQEASSEAAVVVDETEYLNSLYNQIYERNDNSNINVAVILPFMLKQEMNVRSSLYTEYYQGFLLAVDSLKRQGHSINIHAYDSEDSLDVVREILTDPALTAMDLIIAPDNDSAIDLIADFGEKHDINVVNTFSMKNEKVNTNARLFQTNIPGTYLYAESIALFLKTFSNKTVVFLHNNDNNEADNEFITNLKSELAERNMQEITCNYTTVLELSHLGNVKNFPSVVFVPTSNKKEALATILPALDEFVTNNPQCDVALFGYPSWVPQINKNINRFYKLDTYMFSRFYTIPNDNRLYDLSIKYLYWYNNEMKNASPRYALLGFDTGMYFMSAIAQHGKNFAQYDLFPDYSSLQTDFKFERINNWSGFINKSFYFVHLSPDHTIEKISD